mgnify:CR=1 FL=1
MSAGTVVAGARDARFTCSKVSRCVWNIFCRIRGGGRVGVARAFPRAAPLATRPRRKNPRDACKIVQSSFHSFHARAAAGAHDDVVLDSLVKPSLPIKDAVERVHGIKASDLDGVAFTLAHAQAALAQLCSDRTVLIGHAVANDLEALRFRHGCIVDTSVAYGVVGAAAGVAPSLRDVAAAVLPPAQDAVNKSATHDSRVDARTAALCAYHLIGGTETLPKAVARRKHAREERSLFAHRIPAGVDDATLKAAVERTTGVALAADATIARGDAYGKCALVFKSPLHAQLAFDTLAGPAEEDTSGRPQKKIYLDDGGGSGKRPYCKVRPF